MIADDVVARSLRPVAQRGEEFMRGTPAVERRDQGLDDRDRPIVAAGVAPGLEEVRLGNLPLTQR